MEAFAEPVVAEILSSQHTHLLFVIRRLRHGHALLFALASCAVDLFLGDVVDRVCDPEAALLRVQL